MSQATFVAQQAATGGAPRKGTIIAALAPTLSEADGGEYIRVILQAHIDARTKGTLDEFWDMLLLEGSLITVAFMNPGDREAQIMHSIGKFTGGFTSAQNLRGRSFGFRGDRDEYNNDPYCVELPKGAGSEQKVTCAAEEVEF